MSDDMMIGRSKEVAPPEPSSKVVSPSILEKFTHSNKVSERTRAYINQSVARPKTEDSRQEEVLNTPTSVGKVSEEVIVFFATQGRSALAPAVCEYLSGHAKRAHETLSNEHAEQHAEMAQCVKKLEVALLFLQD